LKNIDRLDMEQIRLYESAFVTYIIYDAQRIHNVKDIIDNNLHYSI